MDKVLANLAVSFEESFLVRVFVRISESKLFVCKVMFDAETKDYEIYES